MKFAFAITLLVVTLSTTSANPQFQFLGNLLKGGIKNIQYAGGAIQSFLAKNQEATVKFNEDVQKKAENIEAQTVENLNKQDQDFDNFAQTVEAETKAMQERIAAGSQPSAEDIINFSALLKEKAATLIKNSEDNYVNLKNTVSDFSTSLKTDAGAISENAGEAEELKKETEGNADELITNIKGIFGEKHAEVIKNVEEVKNFAQEILSDAKAVGKDGNKSIEERINGFMSLVSKIQEKTAEVSKGHNGPIAKFSALLGNVVSNYQQFSGTLGQLFSVAQTMSSMFKQQ